NQAFPNENLPELRLETLQQCRIFGEKAEVLLWRKTNNWKARIIEHLESWKLQNEKEIAGGKYKCFKIPNADNDLELIEEQQILWGTQKDQDQDQEHNKFTFLSDGSEGLKYAVPLTKITFKKENLYRPLRLLIHHYIDYDESGIAKIVLSRLVNLIIAKENNQKNDTEK
ncbi:MAG: CRISPR-associated protein Csx19, partial [Cyanobacteriota bacterium]|nr:CRISPR-associated protein Csx19 [Cyanobacteriota bacterium]